MQLSARLIEPGFVAATRTLALDPLRRAAPLVALALLAACGGAQVSVPTNVPEQAPAIAPTAVAPTPEPPTEVAPAFQDQQFPVDLQLWHSGFRVELGQGQLITDQNEQTGEYRYFVSIAAAFENLGDDHRFFDPQVALVSNGNSYSTLIDSEFPAVPSGLTSGGELIFEIDPDFELARAQLVVGSGDENRAQIPLVAGAGEVIALEPAFPAITGEISMELIDLTITSAGLRADRPVNYTQVEEGKLALTLYFDATSRRGGNWSINPQDFALILPSGSAVAADGAELGSLPGSAAGLVTTDLYVRFLVDDPPSGVYTLRFTPGSWLIGDDGVTEASFDFTIEERIRGSSRG